MSRIVAFFILLSLLNTAVLFPKYNPGGRKTCAFDRQISHDQISKIPSSLVELFVEHLLNLSDEVPEARHPNPTLHLYRAHVYKISFAAPLLFDFRKLFSLIQEKCSQITYPDRIVFLPEYYSFLLRLTPF